jgi:hypothetical protein
MKQLVRFSSDNAVAFEHFKPVPVKTVMPDWFAKLEMRHAGAHTSAKDFIERGLDVKHVRSQGFTAKACMPMRDYMTSGYVLKTHSDISFTVEQDEEGNEQYWYVTSDSSALGGHGNIQLPSTGDGVKRDYIKFINPWTIRTPPGYSCLFYQPEYLFEDRFRLFPATVDTDKYDQPINFPGKLLKRGSFIIEAGTPIMCVFPFKRDDFTSEVVFGKEKASVIAHVLSGAYKKFFRVKRSYE